MNPVDCNACRHFRTAPYQARKTGCWHPDNMVVSQKDAYLDEQQIPGNHLRLNKAADCGAFEAKPAKKPLMRRLFSL